MAQPFTFRSGKKVTKYTVRTSSTTHSQLKRKQNESLRLIEISDDYFELSNHTEIPVEQKLPAFILQRWKEQKQDDAIGKSPDILWMVTALNGKLRIWCQHTESYFKTLAGNMISAFFKCRFSTCGNFIRFKLQSGHVFICPTTKNTESNLKDLGRVKFYQNKRL